MLPSVDPGADDLPAAAGCFRCSDLRFNRARSLCSSLLSFFLPLVFALAVVVVVVVVVSPPILLASDGKRETKHCPSR